MLHPPFERNIKSKAVLSRSMSRVLITASVFVILLLLTVISGCTFVLPETRKAAHTVTQPRTSSTNITITVQAVGETQRYSLNPFISYSAKHGHRLAVYEVNMTNLETAIKASDTAFFTLVDTNGTTYSAILISFSPQVIQRGESISGTVVFELPLSAVPSVLRYNDGTNQVSVGVY